MHTPSGLCSSMPSAYWWTASSNPQSILKQNQRNDLEGDRRPDCILSGCCFLSTHCLHCWIVKSTCIKSIWRPKKHLIYFFAAAFKFCNLGQACYIFPETNSPVVQHGHSSCGMWDVSPTGSPRTASLQGLHVMPLCTPWRGPRKRECPVCA